jgi:hypothetical protein
VHRPAYKNRGRRLHPCEDPPGEIGATGGAIEVVHATGGLDLELVVRSLHEPTQRAAVQALRAALAKKRG